MANVDLIRPTNTVAMKDILSFCPELAMLIGGGEVTGKSDSTQKIGSLSTVNNLVILRNLFTDIMPQRTLEVGLGLGGSAMLFTASHREAGRPPMAQHTAIDPVETSFWDDAALVALENAGLRGYLDFRPVVSSIALPTLIGEEASFELIYIDGSHLFEEVFVDFYFATRLLTDGGIVAFDDSTNPHVKKVLRFIRTTRGCLSPVDLSRYRADKGRSLRSRAAKTFRRTQLTAFRKSGQWIREFGNTAFTNF
jgi:predicted O-methyltransferase YrrM